MAKAKSSVLYQHDTEAEKSVIAGLLLGLKESDTIFDMLKSTDFYWRKHQLIFASMERLRTAGSAVDLITVASDLRTTEQLEEAGGLIELVSLQSPSIVGIVSHAKIVADCAQARKVMDMARELMVAAQNASPSDLHQQAAKLAQASEPREMHRSDASALDLIRDFADRDQPDAKPVRPPIPTPWPGLTRILNGGWTGGNRPYYFGARRKNGKTSAGLGIAADAAFNRGFKVILFEIEIAMEATLNRLVSLCSEVPHKSILDRRFTADEHVRYVQALELCYNNNLRIDASRVIGKGQRGVNVIGSKTIEAIRKTIARVVAEGPLDLIVVDHLQVIQPPFPCPIFERVTQASNGLAAITQEFGIPVVAMLQLNDAKGGEPPTALDTRGGQEIGNDCEALILLDRPPLRRSQKEQERLSPAEKEEAALIVALHGSGETGTIPMTYRGECMRWYQAGHETY